MFLAKTIPDPDALKTNVLTKSSGKAFKNKTKEFWKSFILGYGEDF